MILQHTEKLPFIVTLSQAHHYGSNLILAWKRYLLWVRIIVFLGIWSQNTNFLKPNVWLRKAMASVKWYTKLASVALLKEKETSLAKKCETIHFTAFFFSSALGTCPAHIKIIEWKRYLTRIHLPISLEN